MEQTIEPTAKKLTEWVEENKQNRAVIMLAVDKESKDSNTTIAICGSKFTLLQLIQMSFAADGGKLAALVKEALSKALLMAQIDTLAKEMGIDLDKIKKDAEKSETEEAK